MPRLLTSRARAIAIALSTTVVLLVPSLPVIGAASAECRVVNARTQDRLGSLAIAVREAGPGDTLDVWGSCGGPIVLRKNVTLKGHATPGQPRGVIRGTGAGTTLTVAEGVTARLRMIRVQGGDGGQKGGGVRNNGTLYLADSVVRQSTADRGGGIWNRGLLVLRENSRIRRNSSRGDGGGIWNEASGVLRMEDTARIVRNRAHGPFGGGVVNLGTLELLDDSRIFRNRASVAGGGLAATAEVYACPVEHIVSNAPDDCYLLPV